MQRRIKKTASAAAPVDEKTLLEEEDDGPSFDEDDAEPVATDRWAHLREVAEEFKDFRPASEVLTRVKAVPTIFPQFDHGTKIGGFPIERVTLVHGPSGEGKTYFTLGLLKSFLMRNHFAKLIDAERTTPHDWVSTSLGEYFYHPFFKADRPETYEKTVQSVRKFVNRIKKVRDAGKVDDNTSGLIVVDSIRKLVPEDQFKKIMEASKSKKPEKVRDRSAQIKAAMNSAWMDELVPLLEATNTAIILIARETEDPDASQSDKMWGNAYKIGGGKALFYDASLVVRVERAKYVSKKENEEDEKSKSIVYGERHRVTIRKTKVAGKEDRQTTCYYHTSNGVLVPPGFDRARDVLELAEKFGIVEGGSWYKWGKNKSGVLGQGVHNAVKKLANNPELLDKLEMAVREKYMDFAPPEHNDDGEVIE